MSNEYIRRAYRALRRAEHRVRRAARGDGRTAYATRDRRQREARAERRSLRGRMPIDEGAAALRREFDANEAALQSRVVELSEANEHLRLSRVAADADRDERLDSGRHRRRAGALEAALAERRRAAAIPRSSSCAHRAPIASRCART